MALTSRSRGVNVLVVVRSRWSVELEGDGVLDLRVHHDSGYILVATSARGPSVVTKSPGLTMTRLAPPIPRGSVLITRDGVLAAHRPTDGPWRILDYGDAAGAMSSIAALSEVADSGEPSRAGAVRIGSIDYVLAGNTLCRYSPHGELLSSVAISTDPLIEALRRAGPAAMARFHAILPRLRYPRDLIYDQCRNRIVAWAWSMPGWVIAIGLDGAIEWITVPTIECCNFVRLLPQEDMIVHLSSCGHRITFISGVGTTRGVRDFDQGPTSFFANGEGGVVVAFVERGIVGCDAVGALQWTLDCPRVERGIVEEGVMYAVMSPKPGLLEVNAFDLEELKSA